jgi:predicted transcriptional regulator of viral defense system
MTGDRQALRQALYRLAAGQAGFFTAAQALGLGYSYQAQKYHVDHGNWVRVDRGIFRIPEWPSSVNDSLVRWVLWSRHRAVVSHDSAAAAHGLGLLNPAKVHLTVPPGFRMDDPAVVLHRRELPDSDVTLLDGATITTVVRTVLDVIESQFDEELIGSVVNDAVDTGAVSVRQLERRLGELDDDARARAERVLARVSV